MKIEVFIFNYQHFYDAMVLYEAFTKLGYNTYLLNCQSPKDPPFKETNTVIKLPNIYYSGQWNEALKLFNGDVALIINSDVKVKNPRFMMYRLKQFYNHYKERAGIYAPNHYWTPWTYNPYLLETIPFGFKKVVSTDSTIWSLKRNVAEEIGQIDIKVNMLGWGIEIIAAFNCYKKNRLVVRDYNVHCYHPQNTAYNRQEADRQWRDWARRQGLGAEFWKYYNSRSYYQFGWQGHYQPTYQDLKLL